MDTEKKYIVNRKTGIREYRKLTQEEVIREAYPCNWSGRSYLHCACSNCAKKRRAMSRLHKERTKRRNVRIHKAAVARREAEKKS